MGKLPYPPPPYLHGESESTVVDGLGTRLQHDRFGQLHRYSESSLSTMITPGLALRPIAMERTPSAGSLECILTKSKFVRQPSLKLSTSHGGKAELRIQDENDRAEPTEKRSRVSRYANALQPTLAGNKQQQHKQYHHQYLHQHHHQHQHHQHNQQQQQHQQQYKHQQMTPYMISSANPPMKKSSTIVMHDYDKDDDKENIAPINETHELEQVALGLVRLGSETWARV